MDQVVLVHVGERRKHIQRDVLRIVCVQIMFNLRTLPVQERIAALYDGQIVVSEHTDHDHLEQILAYRLIVFRLLIDLLEQYIQIRKNIRILRVIFIHIAKCSLHVDSLLRGGNLLEGKGKPLNSQYNILKRRRGQRFLRVLHIGIDDHQIILSHRKFHALCDKRAAALHDIKQFAERVGMQNALPVPFIL